MVLARDVVVVAVHRLQMRLERLRDRAAQRLHRMAHHDLPVGHGIGLRPAHGVEVVLEMLRAFRQVGKVLRPAG